MLQEAISAEGENLCNTCQAVAWYGNDCQLRQPPPRAKGRECCRTQFVGFGADCLGQLSSASVCMFAETNVLRQR